VSEPESEEEAQVDNQVGPEFFGALKDFFDKEPRVLIWLLHTVAGKTEETLGTVKGLSNDAYKLMGQIRIAQELLWDNDRHDVVLETITDPDTKLGLMRAVALLAKVRAMINENDDINDNVYASMLKDRLEDISGMLYEILKAIFDHAEAKTCESQNP
jgi:hypothetical protein